MNIRKAVSDIGVGVIGDYVGTQLMERVSMKLYEWESEKTRQQEDEVRPGDPPIRWGAVYMLLRRRTDLSPMPAGLLVGTAMSLLVDEGMTPLLGFTAPNRDYPLVTRLRGFVAHLVFGLGTAGTAETIYWLGRNGARGGVTTADEPLSPRRAA